MIVWTLGHSTRTIEELIGLLNESGIRVLYDVRSYPGSRRCPHFNRENLRASLSQTGIEYFHAAALGGRRKPSPESRNTAWRNPSFRAYADYMESEDFSHAAACLIAASTGNRIAMMCAEAVWWRCHRSLIADYLLSRSVEVRHIMASGKIEEHRYTAPARIHEGRLDYGEPPNDR